MRSKMTIKINIDDLTDGAITELLNAHLQDMHKYSPAESIHALDTDKLKDPSMTFWAARENGTLVGCGALKALDATSGEIKSMKTAQGHTRKGIAKQLLAAIIREAQTRGYARVSLETGSHSAFQPAIALYEKYGFEECGPFADYELDPYSRFYTKRF